MNTKKISLIKIAAISFLLTIFWSASAYAQPNITSFSGSLSNGSTITINGNSFGANGPNIVVFDDFESGTNGNDINSGAGSATIGKWDRIGQVACKPKYDNAFSVSGSKAFKADYTIKTNTGTDAGCSAFIDNLNTAYAFLSYWVYLPTTSAFPCYNGGICNWKPAWLYGTNTQDDDQVIPAGFGGTTESLAEWAIFGNDTYPYPWPWNYFAFSMNKGNWYRIWAYIHATNDATGKKELWVMSTNASIPVTKKLDYSNMQIFNDTDSQFEIFSFSAWARWCNNCTESAPRFDDVYLATGPNARARVEIGNSATYNTCTNLTIATVTSWGDTSITATVRQGSFGNLNNAYLYVIDADGNVNANGYLLSDGSGGSAPPPSSGGGGNSSASGGSGCGFVKDDGKGQKAKGEGLTLMVMLIITLAGIAIVRKISINKGSKGVEHIKRITYLSLFSFVVFCIPAFANAADYYVATNGSDSNPGTITQPWLHIAYATCGGSYGCPITINNPNKLKAGDTLYIRGGTYSENKIAFANSGTATQPITIRNYPGETPIIDGGFSNNLAGQSAIGVFEIEGKSYITLDGLEIMRGWRANIYLGRDITTSNIIIQNCVLHDLNAYDNSGHVFFGNYISNITIRNNKMYKVILAPQATGTSGDGVFIGLGSGSYIIENNEMYNLIQGVWLKYKQNDNAAPVIRNNLIHDTVLYGIQITANNVNVTNNIIYNSGYAGIKVYDEATSCSGVGGVGNVIMHNTIVDNLNRGVVLNGPSACTGTLNTILKDNLIYNFTSSEFRGLGVWIYLSVDNSNTTFDHNLIYSSSFSSPVRVLGNYYTTATAPLTGTGNIQQAPIFTDYANKNFTLQPNSPGYKAASDGYDMGADTSLPPTPTPDGGGGNTPPPSSSSGGDSGGGSGGSGCGFVKDDNGEGQGAKGEGLTLMIMLIIALAGIAIAKKYFSRLFKWYSY